MVQSYIVVFRRHFFAELTVWCPQVDLFIGPNQVIGLGTGPGCEFAIQHLGQRLKEGKLWNIKAVPA